MDFKTPQEEIQFLNAVAHGLSDKVKSLSVRLNEAEGLLSICMSFMASIEYDTALDSMQCCGILDRVQEFLGKDEDDE